MAASKFITTPDPQADNPQNTAQELRAQELRAQAARNNAAERRRITTRLRQALEQDEFTMLYQLQTSLSTGAARGAEALICLRHRRRGLVLPNHFMPVAEQSDIVIEIGHWGIMQACRDAANWRRDFFVTVPVSYRQLLKGELVKHTIQALAAFNLEAAQLEFVLTETMLIDENEDVSFALKALRGLGVGLMLGNFGTSYTSLSLLKRLPLTMLKLDRSMIEGLPSVREDVAILRATIDAAHALGIKVIADGMETDGQRQILAELGCDFAQGLHWVPPVQASELKASLN